MAVILPMSMSLDGFVAGPSPSVAHPMGEGGERLHHWLMRASDDPRDAEVARTLFARETVGAVVMGRRTFVCGEQPWGDDGTFGVPCFVVTHRAAPPLVKGPTTFTFVTDGALAALDRAVAAAAGQDVNVMGAGLAQQLLAARRIDLLRISLVPVLLGHGVRLFEGAPPAELERIGLEPSATTTHLTFRVAR